MSFLYFANKIARGAGYALREKDLLSTEVKGRFLSPARKAVQKRVQKAKALAQIPILEMKIARHDIEAKMAIIDLTYRAPRNPLLQTISCIESEHKRALPPEKVAREVVELPLLLAWAYKRAGKNPQIVIDRFAKAVSVDPDKQARYSRTMGRLAWTSFDYSIERYLAFIKKATI